MTRDPNKLNLLRRTSFLTLSVITLDGPAGAGKSSVAREVARRIGFRFLDTGAMYRAVTLAALRRAIDPRDDVSLGRLVRELDLSFDAAGRMLLDGEDVSEAIRSPEVTGEVSRVSAAPRVREIMSALQRRIGERGKVVCEGRDMGSVVFPDARLRLYLDARSSVRAERRARELAAKGSAVAVETLRREIEERDMLDSTRSIAPLRRVEGQVQLDTSDMTFEDVVRRIVALALEAFGPPVPGDPGDGKG